ncbi:Cytochrome bc1 complex Rieske iron-sulfur subunit [bacterium HR40]|nr:Cytochrome bc1 complex Rieske iron-sulfur subunit [bacterium HR40]
MSGHEIPPVSGRRQIVGLLIRGLAFWGWLVGSRRRSGMAAEDAAGQQPQAGDGLVYFAGPRKNAPVLRSELPLGGPQHLVWPVAPDGTVRSANRLNQLLVIRLDSAAIAESMRPFAAEDVLCFSAICTHECCPVNMWKAENRTLYCSCHGSEYDPATGATVVAGPAPRRLAVVPLQLDGDRLVVAGPPVGRVGCRKV